jgi:HAD superfamily hydrolase (TIGR01490 family)
VTAGFFDVDGTLGSTNIVLAYLAFRLHGTSRLRRWAFSTLFLPKVPFYAVLDTFSRERFCEVFYRSYASVRLSDLERWAAEAGRHFWERRLFPGALRQLDDHRARGHRIVLVSGGIEPILRPLAQMLAPDALVAAQPEMEDGRLTGRLVGGPLSGHKKARAAQEIAATLGVDLQQSYAYADSYADREILECVGHPVAVNPDRRLRRLARSRGWQIRRWRHR